MGGEAIVVEPAGCKKPGQRCALVRADADRLHLAAKLALAGDENQNAELLFQPSCRGVG